MGLINNGLMIVLPFLCRTIIIRKLGTEYVGLGSLFTSILQVLSLSELGFGTAIGYILYRPLAENDIEKVNAILFFLKKVYRIIGIIILFLAILLVPFLNGLIAGEVPPDINIYILYTVFVINTVISYFFFAYKKILLSANQRYDIEVNIASCILIVQSLIQIVFLLLFENYYAYAFVIPIMTLVSNFVSLYFVNKLFPGFRCTGSLEKVEIKEILKNTGGAFFSKIGSTVYLSVDNIVISAFLGLTILGIYNNYYYVISSLIAVFAVIHNSIRPVIGNIIVTENKNRSWGIFKKVNYLYMMIVIICCSCCLVLYQDFELIWAGYDNLLGFEIVVLLVIYLFSGRLSSVIGVYLEAAGVLWQGKFIPLISAGINLIVNILLVQMVGLKGVIISSIIGYALISFPGNTYVIFKYLFGKNERKDYLKQIGWIFIICGIDVGFTWLICSKIQVYGWGSLIAKGVITFVVSTSLLLLININNEYIKDLYWNILNKVKGILKK